jgi:hypothetical protein
MVALRSLSTTFGTIARRPALVLPAVALGLLSILSVVAQGSLWSLPVSLLQLLATPFVVAGFIALIEDARTDERADTSFVAAGKRYFLTLLGGNLLVGLVMVVVSGVILVAAVFALGGFDAVLHGEFALAPVNVALVGLLALAGWLFSLLFTFFAPAAVVEDRRVGNAVGRSVEVVTENFVAVIGFALLSGFVSLVLSFAPMWYFLYGAATSLDEFVAAAGPEFAGSTSPLALAVLFATSVVSTLFAQTYTVCFFGACTTLSHGE